MNDTYNINSEELLRELQKLKDSTYHLTDTLSIGENMGKNHMLNIVSSIVSEMRDQNSYHDDMLPVSDIRNKLGPIKNLIAMLENVDYMKGTVEVHTLIQKEIEQCKRSIGYLSGK